MWTAAARRRFGARLENLEASIPTKPPQSGVEPPQSKPPPDHRTTRAIPIHCLFAFLRVLRGKNSFRKPHTRWGESRCDSPANRGAVGTTFGSRPNL